MENIANGLTLNSITGNTTSILSVFSPYLKLLVGILLAFFIIKTLIEFMQEAIQASKEIQNFSVVQKAQKAVVTNYLDEYGQSTGTGSYKKGTNAIEQRQSLENSTLEQEDIQW